MNNNRGRPKKPLVRHEYLEVRLESAEKQAFKDAADLAGIPVSSWVRERLRRAAVRELEDAAIPIAFLQSRQVE
jgi:uncharacterized protein (DUF1778 family)